MSPVLPSLLAFLHVSCVKEVCIEPIASQILFTYDRDSELLRNITKVRDSGGMITKQASFQVYYYDGSNKQQ